MTKQEFITTIYANENQFTAAVHSYINHNYPTMRKFYFHIPNETVGGMKIVMLRKAMGTLNGAPDFEFLLPYRWYLELKMPNGSLSPEQKKLHQLWKSKGIIIETAYNADDVINFLELHLTPLTKL